MKRIALFSAPNLFLIGVLNFSVITIHCQGIFPPIAEDVQCGKIEFSTVAKEFYSGFSKKQNIVVSSDSKLITVRFNMKNSKM